MILFHFHLSGAERVESWEENRICVQLFAPHSESFRSGSARAMKNKGHQLRTSNVLAGGGGGGGDCIYYYYIEYIALI